MDKNSEICGIVAVGPDNVIGLNGVMPWFCASDLYHFRKMTTNQSCIFGRTTFEHLPKQPLPDRLNLVVSSHYKNEYKNGIFYARSLEDAIDECNGAGCIFICGGSQIYEYSLKNDLIDTLYLTVIKNSVLEQQIKQNPGLYCRFPVDIKCFLNSSKWSSQRIIYPKNVLPNDTNNTTAEFYKCQRTR